MTDPSATDNTVTAASLCHVTVTNTGDSYDCPAGTAILDAGLDAGLMLPHSCRGGACGTCKAEIVEGEVDRGWDMSFALGEDEKEAGYCLACQSRPLGPVLRIRMVNPVMPARVQPIRPIRVDATVVAVDPVTPSIRRLELALARGTRLRYRAGQNVDLSLPGVVPDRPYSMAEAPDENDGAPDGRLAFFVSRHPGGAASGAIHDRLAPGDTVGVLGPHGAFTLPGAIGGPVVFLAGGSGLAPVLALIDALFRRMPGAEAHLVYSGRDAEEVFARDRVAALGRRYPGFAATVTLTRAAPPSGSGWRRGRVPAILPALFPDLAAHRVFIAGAPGFVAASSSAARLLGAAPERIHTDSFTPVVG